MTDPSKARMQLFEQHETLRTIMDHCEQLADDVDLGRRRVGDLVSAVVKLRLVFEAHNRFEEQVLRPILYQADAFGEVRVEGMFADHVDEHRALGHQLEGPTGELRATLATLRAHLAAEERRFLSPHVLRDDLVNVEGTG